MDYSMELYSQGYKDSNLEMTESESVALPFGDSPILHYLMNYTRSVSNLQYLNLKISKKYPILIFKFMGQKYGALHFIAERR